MSLNRQICRSLLSSGCGRSLRWRMAPHSSHCSGCPEVIATATDSRSDHPAEGSNSTIGSTPDIVATHVRMPTHNSRIHPEWFSASTVLTEPGRPARPHIYTLWLLELLGSCGSVTTDHRICYSGSFGWVICSLTPNESIVSLLSLYWYLGSLIWTVRRNGIWWRFIQFIVKKLISLIFLRMSHSRARKSEFLKINQNVDGPFFISWM